MGIWSAVISSKDGGCGILNAFRNPNMLPGDFTTMFCNKKYCQRILKMNKKLSNESKAKL